MDVSADVCRFWTLNGAVKGTALIFLTNLARARVQALCIQDGKSTNRLGRQSILRCLFGMLRQEARWQTLEMYLRPASCPSRREASDHTQIARHAGAVSPAIRQSSRPATLQWCRGSMAEIARLKGVPPTCRSATSHRARLNRAIAADNIVTLVSHISSGPIADGSNPLLNTDNDVRRSGANSSASYRGDEHQSDHVNNPA